jgi:nucleotide sugar dehydrogenase
MVLYGYRSAQSRLLSGVGPNLLRKNMDTGRLRFTTSYAEVAEVGDVHFRCAGTPEAADGMPDLSHMHAAADALAPLLAARCSIVGKSKGPVGMAREAMGQIGAAAPAGGQVDLAWNPELPREGFAVQETLRPDRFIFGVTSDWAGGLLRHVYDLPLAAGVPRLVINPESAEMVKVSADDAFLATKISLIDAMANACEATGADVVELAEALAYDERTGGRSFVPGPGMGGGWLAKEIRAFRVIAMSLGLDSLANLRGDVDVSNRDWLAWLADLAREAVGSLAGKRVAVPDVAFKPSLDVREPLTQERTTVSLRDPVGMPRAARAKPGQRHTHDVELTVVMPCLNEAETVASCVRKAVTFLREHNIDGEVIVAENGSTDGSQRLAGDAGARVIPIPERGYGNALIGGIMAARGRFVIMGDADDSYDFTALMPFLDRLRAGADLVMGNRFQGGIAPGAMPALHRYLGNPVLSFTGRLFFRSKIGDFHCGLRGFRRDSVLALGLQASGMEFASEMVVKATLAGHRVEEVPTRLSPDGRSRPPHLRSWRDGWRHLRFLLLFSPRWLFLIPGAAMFALGLVIGVTVTVSPLKVGIMTFDVNTLAVASAVTVIGFQSVLFGMFTQIYASEEGFLPQGAIVNRLLAVWNLERTLLAGGLLALAGGAGLVAAFAEWHGARFGQLNYESALRVVIPSVTALILSCQMILGAFFLSILGIRRTEHPGMLGDRASVLPGDELPEQILGAGGLIAE